MTVQGVVALGRQAAQGLMTDTCTVRRPSQRVFNSTTGEYEVTGGDLIYSGPCRVKSPQAADRVVDAAGDTVSLLAYIVSVPVDASPAEVNDLVTIVTSELDPLLPGTVLRVRHPVLGSQMTARRLGCEIKTD